MYKHNKRLVENAKALRKNMTKEESHLWYDFLRNYNIRFIRQKIVGKYIVDFYCPKVNLAIELDGSQHYGEEGIESDKERTEYLKEFGIKVIRISNLDINKNFSGVCRYIESVIEKLQND
jgi:very-short-patch-repair endonuclease